MGLLQRAIETYDANQALIGIYTAEGGEPLAPIGHILTSASVEITLDRDGGFVSAQKLSKDESKILIPVTEESAGRTNALSPHPLCDQLKYLAPENEDAFSMYVQQLTQWDISENAHVFLKPILTYIQGQSIIFDLKSSGAISVDAAGKYNEKEFVRWRIVGFDGEEPACWKNRSLFQKYIGFYSQKKSVQEKVLCMVTGEMTDKAVQHPKGIIPVNGNAKLISANDSVGFTYRGRFTDDEQAAGVGYVASQKAHSALRWLVSRQSVREFVGNRAFICWNPQGIELPKPTRPFPRPDDTPKRKPSDYRKELQGSLLGFKEQLEGAEKNVVIAAFDAATTGRLAIAYYNELSLSVFLERMKAWDSECCWGNGAFGIQAPNLLQIVDCAFGTQRGAFLETDDKIQRQHLQRLLNCKLNGGVFPADIVQALVVHASTPLAYDEKIWRRILWVTCSALQKYHYDIKQGGNEMDWPLNREDRSFQFGRLLAVAERAEADYYYRTQETRQTGAIKFMSEYRQRPWTVFERLNRQLHQAYLPRVEAWQAARYEKLKDEIVEILSHFSAAELNKPLTDSYLMGYELQRSAFFTKQETTETETEE